MPDLTAVIVVINSVTVTSFARVGRVHIQDVRNGATATLAVSPGATPVRGQDIKIYRGSIANANLEFGGTILRVQQRYEGKPANVVYDLSCVDYTRQLNRRKVTKHYGSQSATAIILDLITNFTTGFTTVGVAAGLPTVSGIDFTFETVSYALDRVMAQIGGYRYLDYTKDLHAFLTEPADAPIPLTPTADFADLSFEIDLSQIRTRVVVEGQGSLTTVPLEAGMTTVPMQDASMFGTAGGTRARVQTERLTYTGRELGGTGSTVNGSQHAPSAPGAPTAALKSPKVHGGLRVGVGYSYKITFAGANGETAGGTASGTITPAAIAGTGSSTLTAGTGGSLTVSTTYLYNVAFVTTSGETAFADSNTPARALDAVQNKITLSSIPISPDARVTQRKIYRANSATAPFGGVAASDYRLVKILNDNTTTSYVDITSDAALTGSNPSIINTASGGEQMALTNIPTGGTGVTSRKIYRSNDSGATYLLVGGINDNSGSTWTDTGAGGGEGIPASAFGWPVPVANTTLGVTNLAQFPASGWVRAENQVIRYTGRSGSSGVGTLTGIPASGTGAIVVAIPAETPVVVEPHLVGVPASGTGAILNAVPSGAEIQLLAQRDDTAAQTALAAIEGGDGILEHYLQDRRLSQTTADELGDAELALFKDPEVRVQYKTRDPLTRSGKTISINLPPPTNLVGDFLIQSVQISRVSVAQELYPLRLVQASSTRFSFDDMLRRVQLMTEGS